MAIPHIQKRIDNKGINDFTQMCNEFKKYNKISNTTNSFSV